MSQLTTRTILGTAAATLALGAPFALAASTTTLKTSLTGKQEAPGPGDKDGKGQATIRVKGTKVCYSISWSKIAAPTDGHIHKGAKGNAGPVAVGLFTGKAKKSGCVTTSAATAKALKTSPADFYVNFHNKDFPNGAIRGQLHK